MIRERQIQSTALTTAALGSTVLLDLPRDCVYHLLQLSLIAATYTEDQAAMTGTGSSFEANFPFSLIRNIRLIRNGSDVVWQGSGPQLAKEHYYLNNAAPWARLYTVAANV